MMPSHPHRRSRSQSLRITSRIRVRTPTFLPITPKSCNSLVCAEASGAQDTLLGELLRSRNERLRSLRQNVISSGFHSETPRGRLTHDVSISIPCEAPGPPCTLVCLYVSPNFTKRLVLYVYIICELHNFLTHGLADVRWPIEESPAPDYCRRAHVYY